MMRLWTIIIVAILAGCTTNISQNTYRASSVGQVNRSVAATVISARDVDVSGTTGTGTAVGVAAGATAGSAIGGGNRSHILGAIGGAVIGGLAGAAVESNATEQRAVEYVVETSNGNLMTIVQGPTPRFAEGSAVLVLYGTPSRIIADPRARPQ